MAKKKKQFEQKQQHSNPDLKMARLRKLLIMLSILVLILTLFYLYIVDEQRILPRPALLSIVNKSLSKQQKNYIDGPKICILLIACDRIQLIKSTLIQLNKIRSKTKKYFQNTYPNDSYIVQMMYLPILVSQDCNSEIVENLIRKYVNDSIVQHHFIFEFRNDPIILKDKKQKIFKGYYKISRHYKWAIDQTFKKYPSVDKIIIIEDDLNLSPDFLEYFIAMAPLLERDDSIYCISAWNDNGKDQLLDPKAISLLHRSDFFPGLGWMLKKSIWNDLKDNWPLAFWDDWFRNWQQRKERACIRPEISRTSTLGRKGVSEGQYFDQHLNFIHHFKGYFPFYKHQKKIFHDLQWQIYDQFFLDQVYNQTEPVHPVNLKYLDKIDQTKSYRIIYYTREEFIEYSSMFGLMSDFKFGVPRTAYKGIVNFHHKGVQVYLAPPISRKIYLIDWK